MKKSRFFIVLGVMLLLFTATSWASDRLGSSQDTPAILASLDQKNVTPLDDAAISEIRGQAEYVMAKIFPLNFLDYSHDVSFTWNPLDWRYGNWGGIGNVGTDPVDAMDALFEQHDDESLSNSELAIELQSLPKTWNKNYRWWGLIYQPTSYDVGSDPPSSGPDDPHFGYIVKVHRISMLSAGGRFFWGYRDMPLTEYARRQAVIAMTVLSTFLP